MKKYLLILFLFVSVNLFAANRYWVGGSGNWNNTAMWSLTSGGSGGALIPTSADDVFFDANSGTGTCSFNVDADMKSLTCTGATTMSASGASGMYIYGNMNIADLASWTVTGVITFTTNAHSVNFGNKTLNNARLDFYTGNTALQSNITINGSIYVYYDGFNTSNYNITCEDFQTIYGVTTLSFGSSVVECTTGDLDLRNTTTISAGTYTLKLSGSTFQYVLCDDGFTLNNILSTATSSPLMDLQNCTINNFTALGTSYLRSSNTFKTINLTAGKICYIGAGETITISQYLYLYGSSGNNITINSSVAGSPCIIAKTGGYIYSRYCTIKDCTFTGTNSVWYSNNSTSTSGNTGIIFNKICPCSY